MDDDSAGIPRALLPEERRERLLAALQNGATHRVDALASELGVTAVTVRRDLSLLADAGHVHRVRGGVRIVEPRTPGSRPHSYGRAIVLGMVVPTLRNYYWPEVARGANAAAVDHGVKIVVRGSSYDQAVYRRDVTTMLEASRLDGLILAPDPRVPQPDLGAWITSLDVPVVLAERQLTAGAYGQPLESVATDHALGAALAVRYLHQLGHRRIGLMVSDSVTSSHLRRGWSEASRELGLPLDGTPEVSVRVHVDPGWRGAVDDLIAELRDSGTTAVLIHPDEDALEFVGRCAEVGLRIPQDVSVISYNDEVANLASPAITAISPPKAMIGRYAVEMVLSRLSAGNTNLPVRRVILTPELVERASTSAL